MATPIAQVPFTYTKPTINWNQAYLDASPGPSPGNGCSPGSFPGGFDSDMTMNGSRSTVDLTPNSSYTCTTASGEISWNSSTEVLTVNGQIFFDGDLTMNNNDTAVYQGIATIYVRGVVTLSNNTELCGVSGCDGSWDPSANSLTFVTYNPGGLAFDISNNGVYQGGAIVEGDYYLTNNAANWGPVISDEFTVRNNSGTFTPIPMPPGIPLSGGGGGGSPTLENIDGTYTTYTP